MSKESSRALWNLTDKIVDGIKAELIKSRHEGPLHIGKIIVGVSAKAFAWMIIEQEGYNVIPRLVALYIAETVEGMLDDLAVKHGGVEVEPFGEVKVLAEDLYISFRWEPKGPWVIRSIT